jgi:hypothetical protein
MTNLAVFVLIIVLIPLIWMLVEMRRSDKFVWAIALSIPVLLATPIGVVYYGNSLLGYPASATLPDQWALIYGFADDEHVYALISYDGQYRTVILPGDYTKNKEEMGRAMSKIKNGAAIIGKGKKHGGSSGGMPDDEIQFYELPPIAPPKDS